MAKYKIVGGPHGAKVAIEGKQEGDEVEIAKARADALIAEGYRLEEVKDTSASDKKND